MIVQVLKKYWVSNDIGFPEQGLNELSENKSNNIINQKKNFDEFCQTFVESQKFNSFFYHF